MKKLSFLALGSELLSGYVLESNSHWLQKELCATNLIMRQALTIGDEYEHIISSIKSLCEHSDVMMICGGLGPTDDDLTREALAEVTEQELVFHDRSWTEISAVFERMNRPLYESNRKQAYLPNGATALTNHWGTAPGIRMQWKNTDIFVFPGVPSEFKNMCEEYLLSEYQGQYSAQFFKLWGMGESRMMDIISENKVIPDGVIWGTIARKEGVSLHFSSEQKVSQDILKTCYSNVRHHFNDYIYSEENQSPVEILAHRLTTSKLSLSIAESCTGGMLASWFTELSGSSAYFQGGIVAYQNEIKEKLLNVPEQTIIQEGAVSEATAKAMSEGVRECLNSSIGIGITGIAGPGGGSEDKPVGTVCIAVSHLNNTTVERHLFKGSRQDIREHSAYRACLMAIHMLNSNKESST
ncbi:MAG: CinA family nicotinamide mononucleotide deamidase-related protein [Planctomycetes bacterium]|nr:CinA family nicotinamide mononucleotide deamidase-related protein [Planctomycetota bacterium]